MRPEELETRAGFDYLREEYSRKERSTHDIARELGTYPNKVRRALAGHGIRLRDHSQAQEVAIRTGRRRHPTGGAPRGPEVCEAISRGVARSWRELDGEKRRERVERVRRRWAAMSEGAREHMRRAALAGLRRASAEGSRLERTLREGLAAAGYAVEFRAKVAGLEVDLFLPRHGVVVEVDGPPHFLPVFGEAQLARTEASDAARGARLREAGLRFVRVCHVSRSCSGYRARRALENLLRVLEDMLKYTDAGREAVVLEA